MVTPESIQLNIAQGMATEHLSVVGDGTHFEAVIVSETFAGKNRVQRHSWSIRLWATGCARRFTRCR